jgi:hypothetical protein
MWPLTRAATEAALSRRTPQPPALHPTCARAAGATRLPPNRTDRLALHRTRLERPVVGIQRWQRQVATYGGNFSNLSFRYVETCAVAGRQDAELV